MPRWWSGTPDGFARAERSVPRNPQIELPRLCPRCLRQLNEDLLEWRCPAHCERTNERSLALALSGADPVPIISRHEQSWPCPRDTCPIVHTTPFPKGCSHALDEPLFAGRNLRRHVAVVALDREPPTRRIACGLLVQVLRRGAAPTELWRGAEPETQAALRSPAMRTYRPWMALERVPDRLRVYLHDITPVGRAPGRDWDEPGSIQDARLPASASCNGSFVDKMRFFDDIVVCAGARSLQAEQAREDIAMRIAALAQSVTRERTAISGVRLVIGLLDDPRRSMFHDDGLALPESEEHPLDGISDQDLDAAIEGYTLDCLRFRELLDPLIGHGWRDVCAMLMLPSPGHGDRPEPAGHGIRAMSSWRAGLLAKRATGSRS